MAEEKEHEGQHKVSEESKLSSANNSDQEGETFEDAPDSTSRARSPPASSSPPSRSLTNRSPSSSSTTATNSILTTPPPLPDRVENMPPSEGHGEDQPPPKSPLLTSHRMSTASLDDVNLEESSATNGSRSRSSTLTSKTSIQTPSAPPQLPLKESTVTSRKPKMFSGSLGSLPWSATASAAAPAPTSTSLPVPAPPSRKLSSPFSWLSRNPNSAPKEVPSPPLPAAPTHQQSRRGTTSSLATVGSNPEMMLSRIEDGHESDGSGPSERPGRNSLRDRFKVLRMREEMGISNLNGEDSGPPNGSALAGLIGRSTGLGLGVGSPISLADEREGGPAGPMSPISDVPPKSPLPLTVNPNLAPGTVSGVSAGPSAMTDPTAPVDWDLWQSVVYEGPAAVARTSPEELNRAIASGIPSAIRGVVWQVLAQSKNEELENVYRELVIRGTDKDPDRMSGSSTSTSATQGASKVDTVSGDTNGNGKEKEPVESSASSVHSNHSPTTALANGVASPTPSHDKDSIAIAKLQAELATEKKRKAKADAASLQKLEKAIKRDLGARTSYSKYVASAGLQDSLFGICKAYALFDEGVGYAQGINFLAMPLLFNMPVEEAFCLLVRLMNHYHLRDMFIQDMPGLHLHLYQFERLLEDFEPALYCHLHRKGVTPQLYATQWFLTLFAYRFPLQLVLRVYDLILSEGLEGAILKFGIVVMQKNAQTLLGMTDMVAITTFLKEKLFDIYIDSTPSANSILDAGFFGTAGGIDKDVYRADTLVQDACAVKITPEMLKGYNLEWEEKMRLEREREAELESLRSSNTSLSVKIRSLEERAEKYDTEHVQVASELVRTKVENEELKDENETLKGQVTELRSVVDKQPEEVEQMLKGEMERILKRNQEVHEENQQLEQQMTEMEQQMVAVKMEYAEINSAHETLKQKWNDLRKAVDF